MHAGGAVVAGNDDAVGRAAAAAVLFGHRHRSAELAPSSSTSAVAFVWQPRSHKLKPLTRACCVGSKRSVMSSYAHVARR